MGPAKNRKLCFNCDASVHTHATKCPYCGTELSEGAMHAVAPPPPYAPPESEPVVTRRVVTPPPPYNPTPLTEPTPSQPQPSAIEVPPPPKREVVVNSRAAILPMLLLLPGAFFMLFGAILILFSSDGTLTLRWNAHYWVLYLAFSLPLLYFGWRALERVEEQSLADKDPPSNESIKIIP